MKDESLTPDQTKTLAETLTLALNLLKGILEQGQYRGPFHVPAKELVDLFDNSPPEDKAA